MSSKSQIWILGLLYVLLIFLTLNKHSKSGYFNYHSELWADKAGYYVYLPAAFIYGFDASRFPDSIDSRTGEGFRLEPETGLVATKYTMGVAMMELPFFWVAHLISPALGYQRDGFGPVYHKSIDIAAVTYLWLGLLFLFFYIKDRSTKRHTALLPLVLLLATNLYYYGIDETGMSHVYSFMLYSLVLYLSRKIREGGVSSGYALMLGLVMGLIVLIRPTSIFLLIALVGLDAPSISGAMARLWRVVRSPKFYLAAIAGLMVWIPQVLYWQYLSGAPIAYSYGEEGFDWMSPKLLYTWFSTDNGLFVYTPFYLVIVYSFIEGARRHRSNATWVFMIFLLISYVFSCWWAWDFGCSFGARSYVEYLALFSLPLASTLDHISLRKLQTLSIITLLCIVYNLLLTYKFDECYYGEGPWDWKWVENLLVS